jgi:hypothetical protein
MNEIAERMDPQTGELMTMEPKGFSGVAVQIKTEIEAQIARAEQRPRSLARVQNNIHSLVMLDEETAAECVYALPRGGKPIKGASVRFAEIVASQYGNCHVGSRVVAVDKFEKVVIAEGVFIDYETGLRVTEQTQRRIVDRNGKLYNDDMIVVTGNAARSIAMRNAVLKGVPKALWRKAYAAAEQVIAGDVKTLAVRRGDAIKAFATFGITPEQIFAALEVEGLDDIGLDEIGTLTAMFKSIKGGEQSVEDYFPAKVDPAKAKEAAKGTAAKLADLAKNKAPADKAEGLPDKSAGSPDKDQAATQGQSAPETGKSDLPDADGPAIAAARQRGRDARGKGIARKAIPGEFREEGREAEADAWAAGWDEGKPA